MSALLPSPLSTRIPFIFHHVLQSHIVQRTAENLSIYLFTSKTIIQNLITSTLGAKLLFENISNTFCWRTFIHKCRSITKHASIQCRLAKQLLKQLGDRHTTGNRMRIDNYIWNNTICHTWHIGSSDKHANSTLLTVSVSKLITKFRRTILYNTDFHKTQTSRRYCDNNLLYSSTRPHLRCN